MSSRPKGGVAPQFAWNNLLVLRTSRPLRGLLRRTWSAAGNADHDSGDSTCRNATSPTAPVSRNFTSERSSYSPSSFKTASRKSCASGLESLRGCGSLTSKVVWIVAGRGDSTMMRSAM
jgi:hypothetical protein